MPNDYQVEPNGKLIDKVCTKLNKCRLYAVTDYGAFNKLTPESKN